MKSFRNTPIRQKLIAISLLSSAASLVLAGFGFLIYEVSAHRKATVHRLEAVATVIARNSSSALDFDDVRAARQSLSALRAETMIMSACIYDASGAVFAVYQRDNGSPACNAPEGDADIVISLPVETDGFEFGSIQIRAEPVNLPQVVLLYLEIIGLVMLLSALGSLPLASALQRFISGPILRLVKTSKQISTDNDFSVRAISEGNDELGELVTAFNEMLEKIESRDRALASYSENLEEDVARRTHELETVNNQLRLEMSQRRQAEERTRTLAYFDGLTGLPNRQSFQERLERILAAGRKYGRISAVLFIDLDRFKQVNDTLGHGAGDALLQEVAQRLTASVRATDWVSRTTNASNEVSRLGGDEFTIVLPDIRAGQDAAAVAQRTLDALAEPIEIDTHQIYTTGSIGIAIFPTDGEDSETLLRNADTAMYHAKGTHPNNFQFYTEEMNATAARKLELANRLRRAVARGNLELHYQPMRHAVTSRLTAVEALIRWNDDVLGEIEPEEFIRIAEDTGLIIDIGEWVLRTACAQARVWQDAGYRELRMSVNVSTHQLRHPTWPGTVARVLADTGLSPGQLELEVTESAILGKDDATVAALAELHAMGVGIALDDFGTGYSSLSYLRRFPIARVKIDRSFVRDIDRGDGKTAIAAAILAMAKNLNLAVVAEGVESIAQAEFLRRHGCDELQGYLFSRPVSADGFIRYLERGKHPD